MLIAVQITAIIGAVIYIYCRINGHEQHCRNSSQHTFQICFQNYSPRQCCIGILFVKVVISVNPSLRKQSIASFIPSPIYCGSCASEPTVMILPPHALYSRRISSFGSISCKETRNPDVLTSIPFPLLTTISNIDRFFRLYCKRFYSCHKHAQTKQPCSTLPSCRFLSYCFHAITSLFLLRSLVTSIINRKTV